MNRRRRNLRESSKKDTILAMMLSYNGQKNGGLNKIIERIEELYPIQIIQTTKNLVVIKIDHYVTAEMLEILSMAYKYSIVGTISGATGERYHNFCNVVFGDGSNINSDLIEEIETGCEGY